MSLKRNLVSNYFGQAYAAAIGMVMLPVYVRYLGAESYGLVGFFAMMQAWGQLFDLGLTPTLSRELSRAQAGAVERVRVAIIVRATEWFFGLLGATVAIAVAIASGWIARAWLKPQHLSIEEMRNSVLLMGTVMALRWLLAMYRGALAGLERMVALNVVGTVFSTIRSVGVVLVLMFWSTRPVAFFAYQLAASALELGATHLVFYRRFPMRGVGLLPRFGALRTLFAIAGSMAFLTALWVVINQTDKFVLSGAINLREYGFYIMAVTLAAGITLLATPMTQALQPRFTILVAQGQHEGLTRLYRGGTQAIAAVVFAVAGVMACFASPLLRAWTGNLDVARESARILPMYAVGNAVAAVLSIAFLLQFAHAKLRWHVIGNAIFAVIWFPAVIWAARHVGAVGVGWVWLAGNTAYLVLWLPFIHRWLIPGLWWRWLAFDVGAIALVEAAVLLGLRALTPAEFSRPGVAAFAAVVAALVAGVGLLVGGETRRSIARFGGTLLATKPA